MDFTYTGKSYLREGFHFPDLADYITDKKVQLSQPLTVPVWATAGEDEWIREYSDQLAKDPYMNRVRFNETIRSMAKDYSHISLVSYEDNPQLYEICLYIADKLAGLKPLVYVYEGSSSLNELYNAFAIDYQDKVLIHFSQQFFQEPGMLCAEELCWLAGHEMGHSQCHHSTMRLDLQKHGSDREYSADRAGLIAAASWIRKQNPHYTMEAAAREAVIYAASTLHKLTLAYGNGPGKTKWTEYDYAPVERHVDRIFDGAAKLPASDTTHPHDKHRIMAMVHFSKSQMFYRCMDIEDLSPYPNLYNDETLQTLMSYHLTGKTPSELE